MQEEKVQPKEPQNSPEVPAAGKSIEEQLADALAKIEQQRDTMMRAVAEAENARKRTQAEAAVALKFAVERFAESLLPVADALEAALQSKDTSGIELTLRQLRTALEKASIREISPAAGERFDPHRHQAMAAVPAAAEPNSVVAVMQKGYALHDRVLRPALVTVAKPVENPGKDPISGEDLD